MLILECNEGLSVYHFDSVPRARDLSSAVVMDGTPLGLDLLLQLKHAVEESFSGRRASWHVDIYWNNPAIKSLITDKIR